MQDAVIGLVQESLDGNIVFMRMMHVAMVGSRCPHSMPGMLQLMEHAGSAETPGANGRHQHEEQGF